MSKKYTGNGTLLPGPQSTAYVNFHFGRGENALNYCGKFDAEIWGNPADRSALISLMTQKGLSLGWDLRGTFDIEPRDMLRELLTWCQVETIFANAEEGADETDDAF